MTMKIDFSGGRQFDIKIRDHVIKTDLPETSGGKDLAPTPAELFIASLGACAGLFGVLYMETAKLETKSVSLDIEYKYDESKTRIDKISIKVKVPNADLGARRKALLSAMDKCIVHNTLRNYPEVDVEIQ